MVSHWLDWLRYNLWYLRNPPWESGTTPPEVLEFIQTHAAGSALDLGCGSGINLLTLARAGWQVTGVDFALKAVARARRRLSAAGLGGEVLRRDVTDLDDLAGTYNFILDMGCFHSLSAQKKARYTANIVRLLAPGGIFLLYGMIAQNPGHIGMTEADLARFSSHLRLNHRVDGTNPGGEPSTWLSFRQFGSSTCSIE